MTACVWLSACALSCDAAIIALSPQRGGVALSAGFIFVFGQGGLPGFTVCTCILAPDFGISRGGWRNSLKSGHLFKSEAVDLSGRLQAYF